MNSTPSKAACSNSAHSPCRRASDLAADATRFWVVPLGVRDLRQSAFEPRLDVANDILEHRHGQSPGIRVVSGHMIAVAEDQTVRQFVESAMLEAHPALRNPAGAQNRCVSQHPQGKRNA